MSNNPMRALWGALVGDAAGAVLEFYNDRITEEDAVKALQFPGGGALRVGPGQITDDGELSLALWSVLQRHHPANGFPATDVAQAYAAWYDSMPFDIGRTCSMAFEYAQDEVEKGWNDATSLKRLMEFVTSVSSGSQANGAMMRVSPVAVWHAIHYSETREPITIAECAALAAAQDARLSHPNQVVRDANAVYVYALTLLLLGQTPQQAFDHVETLIRERCHETVEEWLDEAKRDELPHAFAPNIGHVRYAFVAALWFLQRPEITFEEALKQVLLKGGDTDTNAAIVGAMVACYQPIPQRMIDAVYGYDCLIKERRPAAYGVMYQLPPFNRSST